MKGFNHLGATKLAADPIVEGFHRSSFFRATTRTQSRSWADLANQLGFAPVNLGKLNEGGRLVHARAAFGGQLISQDLFKKEQ